MKTRTETDAPTIHLFEQAGLGVAPFRVVGFDVQPKEIRTMLPDGVELIQKGGGSCDYCGNGIMTFVWIKGVEGERFKVGTTCCEKVGKKGDRRLLSEVQKLKRKATNDKRRARDKRKIREGYEWLSHLENRNALRELPHPAKWAADNGQTHLDGLRWMLRRAGVSGTLRALKAARKAVEA